MCTALACCTHVVLVLASLWVCRARVRLADIYAPCLSVNFVQAYTQSVPFADDVFEKAPSLPQLVGTRAPGMGLLMSMLRVLQMQMAVKTKGQRDDITVIVIDALPSEDLRVPPALQQKKSNSTLIARQGPCPTAIMISCSLSSGLAVQAGACSLGALLVM